jgi:putative lipoprotein
MRGLLARSALAAPVLAALALSAPPALADGPRARAAAADPWFGDDKARHFCASIALAGGGYALGSLATNDFRQRLAVGAAVALGAGLAKEAFDAAGYGTPSVRDLVWDVLGTSAGLGLSLWFDLGATPIQF